MNELVPAVGQYAGQYGAPVVLLLVALLKWGPNAVRTWRASRHDGTKGAVADAATTNALLLASLKAERAENRHKDERIDAKDARIDALEAEIEALRTQMFEQRKEYETQLNELRSQLANAMQQLDQLQVRLHADFNLGGS